MNTYPNETLERHSRKCSICRHPDRDAIEDEFLHWHRVIWIAQEFHIADHRSIYRHARAVGLIKARRENLHSALDNIVEQSDGIRASASDVLRAIRAYSCLDPSTGRWTEPRKEVAMTYTIQKPSEPAESGVPATGPGNANLPIGAAGNRSTTNRAEGPSTDPSGFVGPGFRDVCVPDVSAGSPDITDGTDDPSTFSALPAEPASASKTQEKEGGFQVSANAVEPAPDEPEATPTLPAYTGLSPEERHFWDQLAGIDHRPYGRR